MKIIDVGVFFFFYFVKMAFPVHFLFKWRQNLSARPGMLLFHVLHRLQHKQFFNSMCSTRSSFASVWMLCVSLEGYIDSPNIYWTSCLLSWVLVVLWMETTSLLSRGDSNRSKLKMFWGDTLKSMLRVIRVARLTPFCRRTLAFSSYSVRRVVPGVRLPASSRASRWLIVFGYYGVTQNQTSAFIIGVTIITHG